MKLYVRPETQWLYPDEEALGSRCYQGEELEIHTAGGSPAGVQLLATGLRDTVEIREKQDLQGPRLQVNILRPVQVNFNTAQEADESEEVNGGRETDTSEEIHGASADFGKRPFVYAKRQKERPRHCTRLAPFWVYDAYKPYEGEPPTEGRQAFYLCFSPDREEAGVYEKEYLICSGDQCQQLRLRLFVYKAGLQEEGSFQVSNWFSLENMARFHGLKLYSQEHFAMIGRYAKAMKRMRQTHFMLNGRLLAVHRKGGRCSFDLSLVEKTANIFFQEGLKTLAFGPVGTRERVGDQDLKVLGLSDVSVDSEEGEEALHGFFQAFAQMARAKGWTDRIVFHLADEPDEPASAIPARLRQYGRMRGILKEYFPDALVCEAVKTAAFRDYVDILVPLSKSYEGDQEAFLDSQRAIWLYTCCVPTGNYYQRFLDVPLVSSRYLFWAMAKYGIQGYLHWGLNQLEPDQDPFCQTNQYHTYGDGACLPAGDSHILYPDGEKLYYSMRLEACRKGCEDVELLRRLKEKDPKEYARLTEEPSGFHGRIQEGAFEALHRKLLRDLSR